MGIRRVWCVGCAAGATFLLLWGTAAAQTLSQPIEPTPGPTTSGGQLFYGSSLAQISTTGEKPPADVYVKPSLSTGVVYDDNVFFSPRERRQDDVILRISPGLQAGYHSTPLSIVGNYRFDSEVFHRFTEFNSAQQRQYGNIELTARPSSRLTISNDVGYFQTRTPFDLNALTGVLIQRIRAERYLVNPGVDYRIDPLTRMGGGYAYTKDLLQGGIGIDSHTLNLTLDRRISSHDAVGPAYVFRHYTFGGEFVTTSAVTSHALTFGWAHEFATRTRLELRAGPRVTEGDLDDRPEARAAVRQRLPGGELFATYTSALTTIIGQEGGATVESLFAGGTYQLFKNFQFSASGGFSNIKNPQFDLTAYTATADLAYQLSKYMFLRLTGLFTLQEGNFSPVIGATPLDLTIPRNTVWFRLEFNYPWRLGQPG